MLVSAVRAQRKHRIAPDQPDQARHFGVCFANDDAMTLISDQCRSVCDSEKEKKRVTVAAWDRSLTQPTRDPFVTYYKTQQWSSLSTLLQPFTHFSNTFLDTSTHYGFSITDARLNLIP